MSHEDDRSLSKVNAVYVHAYRGLRDMTRIPSWLPPYALIGLGQLGVHPGALGPDRLSQQFRSGHHKCAAVQDPGIVVQCGSKPGAVRG